MQANIAILPHANKEYQQSFFKSLQEETDVFVNGEVETDMDAIKKAKEKYSKKTK